MTEIFLISRIGLRRTLLRPEAAAAVTTLLAYAVAVLLFARPYVFESLPDIARVYWAFNTPDVMQLMQKAADSFVLLLVAALSLPRRKWPVEATLFTLAAAGFMVAALLQWKAYSYHLYPVIVFTALALTTMLAGAGLVRTIGLVALSYLAVVLVEVMLDQMPSGRTGNEKATMVRFVNDHTPEGGRFLAMSTHPFPGFPTTLMTHAEWAPRTNSRLFLPAVVRLVYRHNPDDAELLAFAAAKEHEAMLRDMTPPPDLVLVDVSPLRHAILDIPFDFVSFYREDPAFAALWRNYQEIPGAPEGYRAYGLSDGASR